MDCYVCNHTGLQGYIWPWLWMRSAGHPCVVAPIQRKRLLRQVGRRIAELRGERGLTQEALAARLRMSDRYLRRIEAGEINLTLASLARIANRLDVPIAAFLE